MAVTSDIESRFIKILFMQENMGIDTKITFLGHLEHILGGHIHSVAAILKMADNTLKATSLARLS